MSPRVESSDELVLDLLRRSDGMTVSQLAAALEVTATAVRQRLRRLIAGGLVDRRVLKSLRGRPAHRYALTDSGRRQAGSNFSDLAVALWEEVRAISDPEVRRGMLQRISDRLAAVYKERVSGESPEQRMDSLVKLLAERDIPFAVGKKDQLPVLTAHACPYTDLAEQDRSVCAMERMLFSRLLGRRLRLSQCRLDGPSCCTFELN